MGLFRRDFDKPGPGVPKNAPRKKGFARFFEILGRDIGNLVKVNLLYQACVLPAQLLLIVSILGFVGGNALLFLVCSLLGAAAGILVGPAGAALNYCVSKMLRDVPGFVGHDFKKALRENFNTMAGPGILYAIIMGAQVYAYLYYSGMQQGVGPMLMGAFLLSVLLFTMVAPYLFLQAPYLQLRAGSLLKNSLLLAVGFFPRSLVSALIHLLFLFVQVRVFPLLLPFTLVLGYALPCLLGQMWIWLPLDKTFQIEETMKARKDVQSANIQTPGDADQGG